MNHTQYFYSSTPYFCLMPTDLCVSPNQVTDDGLCFSKNSTFLGFHQITFSGPSMGCLKDPQIEALCHYQIYEGTYNVTAVYPLQSTPLTTRYNDENSSFSCLLSIPEIDISDNHMNFTVHLMYSLSFHRSLSLESSPQSIVEWSSFPRL